MKHDKFSGENAREYFRIVYPMNDRPTIMVGEHCFEVIDLSERGVKFFLNGSIGDKVFKKDGAMQGTIMLHEGAPVEVEGRVVRATESEVVVNLRKGVRFSRIIREQWYLIGKYKHLFG